MISITATAGIKNQFPEQIYSSWIYIQEKLDFNEDLFVFHFHRYLRFSKFIFSAAARTSTALSATR